MQHHTAPFRGSVSMKTPKKEKWGARFAYADETSIIRRNRVQTKSRHLFNRRPVCTNQSATALPDQEEALVSCCVMCAFTWVRKRTLAATHQCISPPSSPTPASGNRARRSLDEMIHVTSASISFAPPHPEIHACLDSLLPCRLLLRPPLSAVSLRGLSW